MNILAQSPLNTVRFTSSKNCCPRVQTNTAFTGYDSWTSDLNLDNAAKQLIIIDSKDWKKPLPFSELNSIERPYRKDLPEWCRPSERKQRVVKVLNHSKYGKVAIRLDTKSRLAPNGGDSLGYSSVSGPDLKATLTINGSSESTLDPNSNIFKLALRVVSSDEVKMLQKSIDSYSNYKDSLKPAEQRYLQRQENDAADVINIPKELRNNK